LAFGENLLFVVCVAFACAWCHLSFAFCGSVHPSLRIRVGAGLHLFDDVSYVAGLL
jgi:hypothetical protein